MEDSPRIAVVVNRAAHKEEAARRWPAIQAELAARLGAFEPLFTEAPGHATFLAREALAKGARRVVAVGGDGTANETLNGLLDPSGRLVVCDAVLCPVLAGTANELCRALGHLEHPARAYDAVAGARRSVSTPASGRWSISTARPSAACRSKSRFYPRRSTSASLS